jgi:hypothetical protein
MHKRKAVKLGNLMTTTRDLPAGVNWQIQVLKLQRRLAAHPILAESRHIS